jgi:hypothetical protein
MQWEWTSFLILVAEVQRQQWDLEAFVADSPSNNLKSKQRIIAAHHKARDTNLGCTIQRPDTRYLMPPSLTWKPLLSVALEHKRLLLHTLCWTSRSTMLEGHLVPVHV